MKHPKIAPNNAPAPIVMGPPSTVPVAPANAPVPALVHPPGQDQGGGEGQII